MLLNLRLKRVGIRNFCVGACGNSIGALLCLMPKDANDGWYASNDRDNRRQQSPRSRIELNKTGNPYFHGANTSSKRNKYDADKQYLKQV
jgi:hypothetical protein